MSDTRFFIGCVIWRDRTVEKLDTGPDGFCIPGGSNDRNQVVGSATLNGLSRGFISEILPAASTTRAGLWVRPLTVREKHAQRSGAAAVLTI
jgi:hypothetical protein